MKILVSFFKYYAKGLSLLLFKCWNCDKKLILTLIFSSVFFTHLHAQESDSTSESKANHFLEIGLGLNYHGIRDLGTSPLLYHGMLPSLHLEYYFNKNNFLGIIEENFSGGYIKTLNYPQKDKNRAISFNNELSLNAFFRSGSLGRLKLYTGCELGSLANIRINDKFNNANLNYEILAYLAPSAMLEYSGSWNAGKLDLGIMKIPKRSRNYVWQYAFSLPILTNIIRPGYVTIHDFVDLNSYTIPYREIRIVSWNKLFYMRNRINFYYILRNGNMLKLNYNFNYFSYYSSYNKVKGLNSLFMFSIVFRFTNH